MIKEVRADQIDPKTMRWVGQGGFTSYPIKSVVCDVHPIWTEIVVGERGFRFVLPSADMVKVEVSE